jgi:hypothetical protein
LIDNRLNRFTKDERKKITTKKEFSCRIIEVHEHTTSDSQDKKKEGRYHNSNFPYVSKKRSMLYFLKITSDDLSHLKEREGEEKLSQRVSTLSNKTGLLV